MALVSFVCKVVSIYLGSKVAVSSIKTASENQTHFSWHRSLKTITLPKYICARMLYEVAVASLNTSLTTFHQPIRTDKSSRFVGSKGWHFGVQA
eukprot:3732378-Amphidinium_carterae.1